ncbi:MAG: hypothetical protein IKD07_07790 [Clostridia bacterium]|nr:hypothetical protein [Clostridia bacterium]
MNQREKLIELLNETFAQQYEKRGVLTADHTADFLLFNGVIVPPCKVGQTVWQVGRNPDTLKYEIREHTVYAIDIYEYGMHIAISPITTLHELDIGSRLFLTREEAEKALAEGSGK